jgi:hypothetical protein
VRCGLCQTAFDALAHLHDERWLGLSEGALAAQANRQSGQNRTMPVPSARQAHTRPAAPRTTAKPQPLVKSTAPPGVQPAAKRDPLAELNDPDLTLQLQQTSLEHAIHGQSRHVAWSLGSLLLVVALLAQIAGFHSQALLQRFPKLRYPAQQVCTLIGCQLSLPRDLTALRVLSRDVRPHPRYSGALLINATFSSEAAFSQPYPVLQLGLLASDGLWLAGRQFEPREYLDDSIQLREGMTPGAPIHVVLEVLSPKQPADSFEIDFL